MDLWPIALPAIVLMGTWVVLQGWRNQGTAQRLPVLAALAWLAYWYWESQVVGPDDNIRVDLLLFYPILLGVTVAALGSLFRTFQRRRIPPPPHPDGIDVV